MGKVEALKQVHFTKSVRIPGHNGAYTRVTTEPDSMPGIGTNCLHVKSLVLWGNTVIIENYHMPIASGSIEGYLY